MSIPLSPAEISDFRKKFALKSRVVEAFKYSLVERIRRNENTHQSMLITSANIWRGKGSLCCNGNEKENRRRRRQRSSTVESCHSLVDGQETPRVNRIQIFKDIVKRVCKLNKVFQKMREYAIEKGGHTVVSSAMQLKDSVVSDVEQKDLLFDPNVYKSRYQSSIPPRLRQICRRVPAERSKEDIQNIVNMLKQMKDFRKYSKKMLYLLAKIVKYERFGRRRVIVRKGHIGMSFYVIYSGSVGVVVDGDEDSAFENEEKPANVLRKGDSFGELALVRRSTRSATVVCLENTEFMVVEKDDFYNAGLDQCAREEMLFRCNYMKSVDLFQSWDDKILAEVAEGGRNLEFMSDRVVEAEGPAAEFVYIITKGTCDVLRLLDLTTQEYLGRRKSHETFSSSGYLSAYSAKSNVSNVSLPVYNDRYSPKLSSSETSSSQFSEASSDKNSRIHFTDGSSSCSSVSFRDTDRKHRSALPSIKPSRHFSTPELSGCKRRTQQMMPVVLSRLNKRFDWLTEEALRNNKQVNKLGLGAYIRVDTLTPGKVFGLKYLLSEDQSVDGSRKFILLSSGCDVIRLSKSVLKKYCDNATCERIRESMVQYPSDEDLYQIFKRRSNWRYYREQLVDHIAEHRSNVEKALKERCAVIPKLPKIEARVNSRAESPSQHWKKLAKDGLIEKNQHSTWSVSPSPPPLSEEPSQAPFIQDRIVASKSSQRTLVLTHGGSRVNKLQRSTNAHLNRRKCKTRATHQQLVSQTSQ